MCTQEGWRSHRLEFKCLAHTAAHRHLCTGVHRQNPTLTGQELQERDGHAGRGGNVRQLHYQDRQCLDDDVGHLYAADGQGHHTLAGTTVDEALFQAVNHLTLTEARYEIQ